MTVTLSTTSGTLAWAAAVLWGFVVLSSAVKLRRATHQPWPFWCMAVILTIQAAVVLVDEVHAAANSPAESPAAFGSSPVLPTAVHLFNATAALVVLWLLSSFRISQITELRTPNPGDARHFAALEDQARRFRQLFEEAPIGIYRTTPDGRILDANPALVEMLGYSSFDELSRRNLNENGFEPAYERQDFCTRLERDGAIRGLEVAWQRKDGSLLYVRENSRAVRDEQGNLLYYEGSAEDVTTRKWTEEALRRNEERLRLLVENAEDVFVLHNRDGTYAYYSGPRRYGIRQRDIIGKTPADLFKPADAEAVMYLFRDTLTSDQSISREMQFTWHGESLWFHDLYYPIHDDEGAVVQVGGICRNITERKHEEEIRRSLEQSHAVLMDLIPHGVGESDLEGRVTFSNPALGRIRGYTPEEMLGMHFWDFAASDDARENLRRRFEEIKRERPEPTPYIHEERTGRGETIVVQHDWTYHTNIDGEMIGFVAAITDITSQVRAEQALRESESRFRMLADSVGDMISLHALDTRFEYASGSCRTLLGYEPAELQGRSALDLVHADDIPTVRSLVQEITSEQPVGPVRLRIRRNGGEYLWVETHGRALRDPESGEVREIVAVTRDVALRKRTEDEREELLRQLQEALGNVRTLRGMLPICMSCKKIRDDRGYWQRIENYLREHSDAEFSHGLCPECFKRLYPDMADESDGGGES